MRVDAGTRNADGIEVSSNRANRSAIYAVQSNSGGFAGFFSGNVTVTGIFSNPSDQRYKQNILSIPNALSKTLQLRGVSYEWKRSEFPQMSFAEGRQLGLLAQEVNQVLPEAVQQNAEGMYSVSYLNFIPLLVEAIKEQQQQVETANAVKNAQIEQLKQENTALRQRLEAVEKALEKIANR